MLKFFKNLFGSKQDRDVKVYTPIIDQINSYFESYNALSNDELRNKTLEFRAKIKDYLTNIDDEIINIKSQTDNYDNFSIKEELYNRIDELYKERDKHLEDILHQLLPEAFAVVKQTAFRFKNNSTIEVTATDHDIEIAARNKYVSINGDKAVYVNNWTAAGGEIIWNMLHYDVQLIGGQVLHDGKIAEMATGEGKTLVATLPAYLNGLTGLGVHIVTVNDYLAKRDQEWIGPILEFLFLTVDCIDKYKPHSPQRAKAYSCDVTYGTNNEFGFDYLRDNMVQNKSEQVQKKYHYAMVDEVDSVLIDDARTPLIISGPVVKGGEEEEYEKLNPKVAHLFEMQRKQATDLLTKAKKLIAQGNTGVAEEDGGLALFRAYKSLPKYRPLIKYLSEDGIGLILQKTEHFYMQEQSKNMNIATDFLYFIIDEKNRNVELTTKGADFLAKNEADINFFLMPNIVEDLQAIDKQEEMLGTDLSGLRSKAVNDFTLKSQRLHAVHQLLKAYTLFDREDEYVVINGEVKIVDEQTGRIMEGRRYSDGLHQALEAKEKVKIGDLTQTYATITLQNFFRMYHKLAGMTGTAETEAKELWDIYKLDVVTIPTHRPIVRNDETDLVYKTTREKFNAVIEEIERLTKAGRPCLVGTTSVEISEKLSKLLDIRKIPHNVLNAKQHQREAEIVAAAGQKGAVTIATNMAGRGTDIKISEEVKSYGGLAIIATERHDSRRVDRQLRGRSGRQGDPGSSQFYVSLEDKLMRLFKSERITKAMDKFGLQEGEVIQHSMVSNAIERAQKKVEENNFGSRKRTLEYDDVMNIQREAIYKNRNHALSGDRISIDIYNLFEDLVDNIAFAHAGSQNYSKFRTECAKYFGINPHIDEQTLKSISKNNLYDTLLKETLSHYKIKFEKLNSNVLLAIKKHCIN